jgi:tetratricopeptide (TPR) repeat protein
MHGCRWPWCAALVLALTSALGCNGELSPQARELLMAGSRAFHEGAYDAAIRNMSTFLQVHPGSRGSDEAYFTRGLAKYALEDRPGAKSDLEEAVKRTKLSHIKAHSLNALGDLAWDEDDMSLAESMYCEALKNEEGDQRPADHTRYRLGCVLQRKGSWIEADLQFDRVLYHFGDSALGKRAERRVRARGWSIRTGAFAEKTLADAAAKRIGANFPARVEPVLEEGHLLFLVQVGRYSTYEQAIPALPEVREHIRDAYVTVTR